MIRQPRPRHEALLCSAQAGGSRQRQDQAVPVRRLRQERVRRFCRAYKPEGHVDLASKRCEIDGCNTKPIFGSPSDGVKRFCKLDIAHGKQDMENKMCEVDGCNTGARFGSETDDLVRFCKAHSRDGDVNLQRLQCVEPSYDGRRPRSFSFGRDRDRGRRRGPWRCYARSTQHPGEGRSSRAG